MKFDSKAFAKRRTPETPRPEDWRSPFSRDKARIIHGSGFRRLQGKTQVMGSGEGDFHRTRLTHSLEVNQIGLGLFEGIKKRDSIKVPEELEPYLRNGHPVISAACLGHDLGHPPFGHGGEKALHSQMKAYGGFEGNAQTIRLIVKLEKYHRHKGINPTRKVLLSLLKYPVSFDSYPEKVISGEKPPKCYYDSEKEIIDWCLAPFPPNDRKNFALTEEKNGKLKPKNMTFDASIMDCADDIAFSTHDLEDIVARRLVSKAELMGKVEDFFKEHPESVGKENSLSIDDFNNLFAGSHKRKQVIGKIVNLLMTNTEIIKKTEFDHPLLKYRLSISERLNALTVFLKKELTFRMVVNKPEIQMLERKGQRLIKALYDEFILCPRELIPKWDKMDSADSEERRVCDYIAGMTDAFAVKIYHRLFTPGVGSSRDEL